MCGRPTRMGTTAVICEARMWFCTSRLLNSGTLTWCCVGSLIMR
ncbi:Uncharacterised protein [Bordetella pertussis]|nr:Uncharacterised protein [Bordetella pertussis]CPO45396.1 Uncharacterised protein [Bordetella pertussis]CPO45464.1 Uncharacterised protein [Bordetella pertussis]